MKIPALCIQLSDVRLLDLHHEISVDNFSFTKLPLLIKSRIHGDPRIMINESLGRGHLYVISGVHYVPETLVKK